MGKAIFWANVEFIGQHRSSLQPQNGKSNEKLNSFDSVLQSAQNPVFSSYLLG